MKTTQTRFTFIVSVVFALLYNFRFFKNIFAIYPLFSRYFLPVCSIFIILICVINFVLNVVTIRKTLKPISIIIFVLASLASYTMDKFKIPIDEVMLINIFSTNIRESKDIIGLTFFLYLFLLGIVPSILIYKTKIQSLTFKSAAISKGKSIAISLITIISMLLIFMKFYASFFREHKPLRYYSNPTYFLYSSIKSIGHFLPDRKNQNLNAIGLDAKLPPDSHLKRDLLIFVVGEAARKDHFSLNNYKRETNPLLKKENVFSFKNVTSCGTSTAISVPCMFTNLGREKFNTKSIKTTENLLDVLKHTQKVNILWRDNNSSSKGVAVRSLYQDFQNSNNNPICNPECRDEGMLEGLQKYINANKNGDIMIVLHQMGNHGPAYYKRYPPEFEKFKPTCQSIELSECSNEEIINAYDNAILYTDYFLSKVIQLLKNNSSNFKTAMIYVGDHGESLGENGLYLHGIPYFMAPDNQKKVPLIFWLDDKTKKEINSLSLSKKLNNSYSHDNLFHTVLGLLEVETSLYRKDLDILNQY